MVKISVIIPVFKNVNYIEAAIESILNVSYPNIEIIIVDDCGNDGSLELCIDFAKRYKNIKVIQNHKNIGTAKTILNGIFAATGAYIFIAAADDIFLDNRIEDCLKVFQSTAPFLIFGDANVIDQTGKNLGFIYTNDTKVNNQNLVIEQFKRNQCLGATMAFENDKDIFTTYGEEFFHKSDDYCFATGCIVKGLDIHYLRKPLVKYRLHDTNQSKYKKKMNAITASIINQFLLEKYERDLKTLYRFSDFDFNLAAAIQYIYLRKWKVAKDLLERTCNTENSNLWEKYFYFGVIEYHLKNFEQSKCFLEKSLTLNNEHAATWNNLGVIEMMLQDEKGRGKKLFETALQIKTDYVDAQENLRNVEIKNGKWKFTSRTVFLQLMTKEQYEANFH